MDHGRLSNLIILVVVVQNRNCPIWCLPMSVTRHYFILGHLIIERRLRGMCFVFILVFVWVHGQVIALLLLYILVDFVLPVRVAVREIVVFLLVLLGLGCDHIGRHLLVMLL